MAHWWRLLVDVLYAWQTLITGLLALGAAYFTARPVWRQLRSLQIQAAAMEREVLITRVATIESRRHLTREKIETGILTREMFIDEHEDIDPFWAHDAEQRINVAISALTRLQETSLDGESIDTMLRSVIEKATELSACLHDIHKPESDDSPEPELGLTEEQVAAAQAAAEAAAVRARSVIFQRISAVRNRSAELDAVFNAHLERLRARIRGIDRRTDALKSTPP